jgi:flagellin
MSSINANRQLGITNGRLSKSTEKLSSGYRINRAADDAAGLAISEKLRSQVRGLNQASSNAQDGISMIQTAEGALGQKHEILQRARELVVQASNEGVLDTDSEDFQKIQDELDNLKEEYSRIDTDTEFNKKKLLNGDYSEQILQVGANSDQTISVTIESTEWKDIDITAAGGGNTSVIDTVDDMISEVSGERSKLGAIQNRLEYTIAVDDNASENLQSAESRIRDVDMAEEMAEYSKNNILIQAGTSMLAQANQQNQTVLSLLQ